MPQNQPKTDLLAPHPLVAAATEFGGAVRRFTGYVGDSGEAETVRLFCSLSLDEYWDVPKRDILDVAEVPNANGRVALLVRSDARLPHTVVTEVGEAHDAGVRGQVVRRALERGDVLSSRGFGRLSFGWTIWTVTIFTIVSDDQGGDNGGGEN